MNKLKQIIREILEEGVDCVLYDDNSCLIEEKVIYNSQIAKIEDTLHSRERKRRDNNVGAPLVDKEIVNSLLIALKPLKDAYRNNEIPDNKKVHIFNKKTNANIVIEYHVTTEGKNKIKVLTVMRTQDFWVSDDTSKTIEVSI